MSNTTKRIILEQVSSLADELRDSLFCLYSYAYIRQQVYLPGVRDLGPVLKDVHLFLANPLFKAMFPPDTVLSAAHPLSSPLSRFIFPLSSLCLPVCMLPVYGLPQSTRDEDDSVFPLRTLPLGESSAFLYETRFWSANEDVSREAGAALRALLGFNWEPESLQKEALRQLLTLKVHFKTGVDPKDNFVFLGAANLLAHSLLEQRVTFEGREEGARAPGGFAHSFR
jgi:hypothetical protein